MAKGANQKLKMLYLLKIFWEDTDEEHGVTMPQLIDKLSGYGVEAERKSIYSDMESLRQFGMDIIGEPQGKQYIYYMGSRMFEMPELKLLVDSVQAAKFITERKTNQLIQKLEGLVSRHEAGRLQRQVYVSGRIKTENESIYYNVDKIHGAISDNVQISFQYFQWNVKKEQELRREGKVYQISPWALFWDDENYYLVGYDEEAKLMKHFRVDKMLRIQLLSEHRVGKEQFETFDMAAYTRKNFGMFSGEEQRVSISFPNDLAGVVLDRFGRDVIFFKMDEEHFQVNVRVAVSRQFLGWIMSLGKGVKILGPENVVSMMQEEVSRLWDTYNGKPGNEVAE